MQSHAHSLWWLRIATFLAATLAAASAAYWVLKWMATGPASQISPVVFASPAPVDPRAVARLLGGGQSSAQAVPALGADGRFKLTGVVADRSQGGYALISIDGKATLPYRVGTPVLDALVLHSVGPRTAALAASVTAPVTLTLELPKLAPP